MISIVYCVDPGSFSGTAEAAYYRRNVQNSVELPANISSCADYVTGTIMGQPVVIITSGEIIHLQLHASLLGKPCISLKQHNVQQVMLPAGCTSRDE